MPVDHALLIDAGWGPVSPPAEPGSPNGAPRVRTVTDEQVIFPGVRVRITGGHTAGHAQYGTRLTAFGDALHSPIQVDHPAWSWLYDHDPARSAEHRRRLVAELEEPDTIGCGVHFADAVFGQVRRDGITPRPAPPGHLTEVSGLGSAGRRSGGRRGAPPARDVPGRRPRGRCRSG